ncbi:MAG: hypothetical protein ACRDZ8_03645 [Acidimicrobiales bacterium]
MPEEASGGATEGPSRQTALLLIAGLAVLAAVLLVTFVLRLSEKPGAKVNLGTDEFTMGRAAAFAPLVVTNGPLIFPPPHGHLTLYVQHLGTDVKKGWLAFDAHDPGQPPRCLVRWQPAGHDFVDPCDQATFPADGQGLVQYSAQVNKSGDVIIDLRQPAAPGEATTTTAVP